MNDIFEQSSLKEFVSQVTSGSISPREVATHYLARIEELQPKVNAFVKWDRSAIEDLLEPQLKKLEERIKSGASLPLAGVPIGVKDNICIKNWETTAASKMLEGFEPAYDATAVTRLQEAGALIVGKLNMDEFAMGSSNETSYFGDVRNPWNLDYVPGGSSGGSAAAVASSMVPIALGSDTGGSVRQPASMCGVVGFKPTYGTVSRYGLMAFGSSLDQIGPITRNVSDALMVHNVISGHDPLDATSISSEKIPFPSGSIKGMRVGRVKEFEDDGLDSSVKASFEKSLSTLSDLGAEIVDVSIPSLPYTIATYYILACAEASSNLARYDGIRFGFRNQELGDSLHDLYLSSRSKGFGLEVKKRIMLGTYVLSAGYKDAYYEKALYAREVLRNDYTRALSDVDLLVSPTSPTPAFKLGEKIKDSLSMYLSDVFTLLHNLVACPVISVPCGFSSDGLPLGLQFSALPMQEEKLFNGALSYEKGADIGFRCPI